MFKALSWVHVLLPAAVLVVACGGDDGSNDGGKNSSTGGTGATGGGGSSGTGAKGGGGEAGAANGGATGGVGGSPQGGSGGAAGSPGGGGTGGGGGSSAHPNEPPGLVAFAEYDASALPPSPKAQFQTGSWYRYPANNAKLTLQSDPTAPESPSGVVQTQFPAGFVAGSGPVQFGGWDAQAGAEKSQLYFSMWIKIAGTDYENEQVLTKMGWIGYGVQPGQTGNQGVFSLLDKGPHTGPYITDKFQVGFNQQGNVVSVLKPNKNTAQLMTVGSWHHWEAVFVINDPANNYTCTPSWRTCGDGAFQMWIDGQQTMAYTDMAYRVTGSWPHKFINWYWNPTWGGAGDQKTRDDFMLIDHVYMSGMP
jgi:hypothetical protein